MTKRESCQDFKEEYCLFYSSNCFHENKKNRGDPSDSNRCNRLIPRTIDECMEWMVEICTTCNEVECNDCNVYQTSDYKII